MKEPARLERNRQRLTECFPPFADEVRRTIDVLEAQGFRPRIQDAFRTKEDQLKAVEKGTSKVKFGFHNVTGAGGSKEALACDVLDDDHPNKPGTRYLLALTLAARGQGMDTLIMMDLKKAQVAALEAVLASGDIEVPAVGRQRSDPRATDRHHHRPGQGRHPPHHQVEGRSAKKRGSAPAAKRGMRGAVATPGGVHVVKSGDTLDAIAKQHGTTLAALLELNPQFKANPGVIKVGDKVKLAGANAAGAPAAAKPKPKPKPTPSPASPGGGVHVVQSGDTLSAIAKKHGTTLPVLLELNPKFKPNPGLIHIGDKIRLP